MRRAANAADMQMMVWDNTLQQMAEQWARSCFTQGHRPEHSRQSAQYGYIGENLAWSSALLNERSATTLWYLEKQHYDYNTRRCAEGHECGHYTQVRLLLWFSLQKTTAFIRLSGQRAAHWVAQSRSARMATQQCATMDLGRIVRSSLHELSFSEAISYSPMAYQENHFKWAHRAVDANMVAQRTRECVVS